MSLFCCRLYPEVNYLEATVTPNNEASRKLFKGFARRMETSCKISPTYLAESDFPAVEPAHESEDLFRIGPYVFPDQEK